jgi:hypothetical protein
MFSRTKSSDFTPFADTNILALPGRDFGFWPIVPRAVWVEALKEMAEEQAWSNFTHEAATGKLTPAGHTVSNEPSHSSRNDMSSKACNWPGPDRMRRNNVRSLEVGQCLGFRWALPDGRFPGGWQSGHPDQGR